MDTRGLFDDIIPFVHVARALSFRAAAAALGLTPAAVSKAVKRLEAELGVELLHRTTRHVSLSREGELFLEHCEAAIAQMRAGRELLAIAREEARGELTVTMPLILGRYITRHLPRFTSRYPAISLHLQLTDRHARLADEAIDVAVRIGALRDSSLIARRLMTTRWMTVASPEYLERRGAPQRPADLGEHACLKFRGPDGRLVEWTFESPLGDQPEVVVTPTTLDVDHGELLVEGALAGLGVSQVFSYLAEAHLARGELVEVLAEWNTTGPPIHALCSPGRQRTPRVRALLDFLAEIFQSR